MPDWIIPLLSFLGGGTLIGVLTWIISLRKDKREGLGAVIDLFKEDNTRLRTEFNLLSSKFDNFRERSEQKEKENTKKIHNLELQLSIMESAHLNLPVPQWLKDKDGVMLSINSAFEDIFGITSQQYIGKKDTDVWPKEIAAGFMANDRKVKRTKKHLQIQEMVENEHHSGMWEILKYPRFEGNTFIGIGGIAFKEIEGGTTSALT